jgi:hypothetical protein
VTKNNIKDTVAKKKKKKKKDTVAHMIESLRCTQGVVKKVKGYDIRP